MEPSKTVYVKNYTDELDDVKSAPDGTYFPYSIRKMPMELESFTEEKLEWFHPLATVSEISMAGRVFFTIKGLEFEVKYIDQPKLRGIIIRTDFEEFIFPVGKKVNNLNLFKRFKKSFKLQSYLNQVIGMEGSAAPYEIFYEISEYYFNKDKQQLFLRVDNDYKHFSVIYLVYKVSDEGDFFFKGISYQGVETWIDFDTVIDLDFELEVMYDKKEFVTSVAQQLSQYFGNRGIY